MRTSHYKDLTETGNRARKVSGTQGEVNENTLVKKNKTKQKMQNHIVMRRSQFKLDTNVNYSVAARVRVVKLKAEVFN